MKFEMEIEIGNLRFKILYSNYAFRLWKQQFSQNQKVRSFIMIWYKDWWGVKGPAV